MFKFYIIIYNIVRYIRSVELETMTNFISGETDNGNGFSPRAPYKIIVNIQAQNVCRSVHTVENSNINFPSLTRFYTYIPPGGMTMGVYIVCAWIQLYSSVLYVFYIISQ